MKDNDFFSLSCVIHSRNSDIVVYIPDGECRYSNTRTLRNTGVANMYCANGSDL